MKAIYDAIFRMCFDLPSWIRSTHKSVKHTNIIDRFGERINKKGFHVSIVGSPMVEMTRRGQATFVSAVESLATGRRVSNSMALPISLCSRSTIFLREIAWKTLTSCQQSPFPIGSGSIP